MHRIINDPSERIVEPGQIVAVSYGTAAILHHIGQPEGWKDNHLGCLHSRDWWRAEVIKVSNEITVKINDVVIVDVPDVMNLEYIENEFRRRRTKFSKKQMRILERSYSMTIGEIKEKLASINRSGQMAMLLEQNRTDLIEDWNAWKFALKSKRGY